MQTFRFPSAVVVALIDMSRLDVAADSEWLFTINEYQAP